MTVPGYPVTGPGYPQPFPGYAPRPPSWWRRNRGQLILLAIGVVLAILTSSFTLRTVRAADDPPDEYVTANGRIDFNTISLEKPVVVAMELESQKVATKSQGYQPPPSGVMWIITMKFLSVTPSDARLGTCSVYLVDSQGRRYGSNLGLVGNGPTPFQSRDCDPKAGVKAPWAKTWWFGVPDTAQITSLYVSWDPPRIAVFPIAAP